MKFVENEIFHVYNRGNQKQPIFFNRGNYLYFLQKVRYHLFPVCDLLAYCLMPNHFHFLIRANSKTVAKIPNPNPLINNTAFSKELGKMLSSYTRAIQKQEGFTGSLFQQKTKAKQVSGTPADGSDYVSTCFAYILNNPVQAGFVRSPEDWEYSNYRDLVGLRCGDLCNQEMIREELGFTVTTIQDLLGRHIPAIENPALF
ncbi:hypothetical protein [Flavilitoribacter nigricans]|uniref:Transposase IS200-like domain-containing protein n=1 Tax=Flavilitoribacter nigricans (strain ATCC 23147 / DSM 23189 / NBRC 102662 / NCIMB 1420 / SS-2) TaxID=1122177 RepID=A0A2D0MY45_FLAN2|nr:hypothetical protein [Flavilitoribacter nigricans]PHN01165.1 hypothetical protein CRP01_38465 [Flavilitoribacter nigricans DSM 23189 = NBRC 102662]